LGELRDQLLESAIRIGIDLLQGYLIAKPGRPFPGIVWT